MLLVKFLVAILYWDIIFKSDLRHWDLLKGALIRCESLPMLSFKILFVRLVGPPPPSGSKLSLMVSRIVV